MEHEVVAPAGGVLAELRRRRSASRSSWARARPRRIRQELQTRRTPVDCDNGFVESEERQALRKAVAATGGHYGQDYYLDKARAGEHTDELWSEAGKLGLPRGQPPEEYGGGGAGMYGLALVMEEMAAGGLRAADAGGVTGDLRHDHRAVRHRRAEQRWLPGIADGTITMAFAITEPDAGSNSHGSPPPPRSATAATGC